MLSSVLPAFFMPARLARQRTMRVRVGLAQCGRLHLQSYSIAASTDTAEVSCCSWSALLR